MPLNATYQFSPERRHVLESLPHALAVYQSIGGVVHTLLVSDGMCRMTRRTRGQLMQQAKEGIAMAISAETGENVTQAQRLDKLRREVEFSNAINNIFYGDIE